MTTLRAPYRAGDLGSGERKKPRFFTKLESKRIENQIVGAKIFEANKIRKSIRVQQTIFR